MQRRPLPPSILPTAHLQFILVIAARSRLGLVGGGAHSVSTLRNSFLVVVSDQLFSVVTDVDETVVRVQDSPLLCLQAVNTHPGEARLASGFFIPEFFGWYMLIYLFFVCLSTVLAEYLTSLIYCFNQVNVWLLVCLLSVSLLSELCYGYLFISTFICFLFKLLFVCLFQLLFLRLFSYLMVASCVSSLTVFSPSPQGTTIFTVLKLTVTFILTPSLFSYFYHSCIFYFCYSSH